MLVFFIFLFFLSCLTYQVRCSLYKIVFLFCICSTVYGYVDTRRTFCHLTGLLSANFGDSPVVNIDFSSLQKHTCTAARLHLHTHKHMHTDSAGLRSCSPLCPAHAPTCLTGASAERILMDFQSGFQIKTTIPVPLLVCTCCRSQQSLTEEAAVGGSDIRCLSSPMPG